MFNREGGNTLCNPTRRNACTTGPVSFELASIDMTRFEGKLVRIDIEGQTSTTSSPRTLEAPVNVDDVMFVVPSAFANSRMTSGAWYNPNRSGHGFHISRSTSDSATILWYTYLPDGRPIWYTTDVALFISGVWNSKLYKVTWNTSTNSRIMTHVGDVQIRSRSAREAILLWDLHNLDGDSPHGFDGSETMSLLVGGGASTGLWYEPALSGWGISVDTTPANDFAVVIAFYYDGVEPVWSYGQGSFNTQTVQSWPLTFFRRSGTCPQCQGPANIISQTNVGTIGLADFSNQCWISSTLPSSLVWNRGSQGSPASCGRLTTP